MTDLQTAHNKTIALQAQFICPIWAVWFGQSVNVYFTLHHTQQMIRALGLNGTPCHAFAGNGKAISSQEG